MKTKRARAFAFLIAFLILVRCGVAQPSRTMREQFAHPDKVYRPLVRWWWPGNDVTDAELRREVDVLDANGFGGAEIQPFNVGLARQHLPAEQTARVNDYPTPSFFKHVAIALDEAKGRGMFLDYTFGSGWPFGGGPEITPELASVELRSSHTSVSGPAHFHARLHLPSVTDGHAGAEADVFKGLPAGWPARVEARTHTVAVVAVRGTDTQWDKNQIPNRDQFVFHSGVLDPRSAVDLTARMSPDGLLDWDVPEGTWQVFVFRSVPTLHKLIGGVGAGPQLEMDHFNATAFAAHAERVADRGLPYLQPYLGNTLRGIFCDSLEVKANLYWSDDFVTEFRKRRGYDPVPYLPVLKVQGYINPFGEFADLPAFDLAGGMGDKARRDYLQTLSELMIARFFDPFNSWAHTHHLLARTQAHGAPADILRIYGEADIPETEDLYNEGRYDFLKMAASGAHIYGRHIVGSESFVWRNGIYQTTPEKMKVAADELLTAGVNAILMHGFPYVVPNIAAPGWYPFAGGPGNSHSTQFNELNPLWPYLAPLNAYITRVQYLSQTGTNVADVALFRQELAHAGTEVPQLEPSLGEALMHAGYNYDHLNADALMKSHVDHGVLVTPGTGRYRVLVFQELTALTPEQVRQLETFAHAGLPIVFQGALPTQTQSLAGPQNIAPEVSALAKLGSVAAVHDDTAVMEIVGRHAAPDVRFNGDSLPFFHARMEGMEVYFLRNASDAGKKLDAVFAADANPELWDPWTGAIAPVSTYERARAGTRVHLELAPFGSALLVFDRNNARKAVRLPATLAAAPAQVQAIGEVGWEFRAQGVKAAKEATLNRHMTDLLDWSLDPELRTFTGHGVYTTTFAVSKPASAGAVWLDLGNVREVAKVTVNGKEVSTLLLRPYRVDVSSYIHDGPNTLEVEVTNALFNSMLARTPRTFLPGHTENASGYMSGGLLGPVRLEIWPATAGPGSATQHARR